MKNRLFETTRIGQMELRNRFVMPPMGTRHASKEGYVTEELKNYFEARAQGGFGLVIVEATLVHPGGRGYENLTEIIDDSFIPGLSDLVKVIQRHGAKAALQLQHCGRLAKSQLSGMQPVAPSPIPAPKGEVPRELSREEIKEIVGYFSDAAVRAKRAGFDGIEIHGAHGYLIDQFISPSSNKRKDLYGGSVQNRTRLLVEVIKAVKSMVGDDYPVWCRINAMEYGVEGGTTLEDAKQTAVLAQAAGAHAIHVSAYGPKAPQHLNWPTPVSGVLAHLAEGIKKVVDVPVIAVGRITPEAGERIIAEEKADLVSIGKASLADPEIPSKLFSGKAEDIKPCITCMACRDDLFFKSGISVRCQVNPAVGKEKEFKIIRAKNAKKILIVGGGPAGMEAARVSALRGHHVTLWEKNAKLGGQLNYGAVPAHKNGIRPLITYFETQLRKLGVGIELNKTATAPMVQEFHPDVVVVATGAVPIIPEIFREKRNNIITALDVLGGHKEIQERVLVVGGGSTGCETAEFLAERYKDVILLEMLDEIGSDIGPSLRPSILERLKSAGIQMEAGIKVVEITEEGVKGLRRDGSSEFFHAGTIVIAIGMKSNGKLVESLKGLVPVDYLIGDSKEPRRIRDAIAEGYRVGLEI